MMYSSGNGYEPSPVVDLDGAGAGQLLVCEPRVGRCITSGYGVCGVMRAYSCQRNGNGNV